MAGSNTLPQSGDLIAGKYRIDHELGIGGMGAVYQVTHRVTGKRFALKWLLPQLTDQDHAAERFLREAQVAGRIDHPNVVEVYDVGAEADSFYMVMELLEGESLAARVARVGPLLVADACSLLIPCMHGVAAAHAAGVVHRDLKPANIFICAGSKQTPEFAKVLDFGISKLSGTHDDVASMTKSGTLVGTPHYMPLEQMRGRPVDHRADIYAFGVVLYQVLSGKLPYPADNFSDLVLMLAHETPKPLEQHIPRMPRGLAQIVARAMARESADRYPDLDALIGELGRYASGSPGAAGAQVGAQPPNASLSIPTPLATESTAQRRSHGTSLTASKRWIMAGVAMLLAVVGGVIWLRQAPLQPKAATPPSVRPTHEAPRAAAQPTAPIPKPSAASEAPDDTPVPDSVPTAPEPSKSGELEPAPGVETPASTPGNLPPVPHTAGRTSKPKPAPPSEPAPQANESDDEPMQPRPREFRPRRVPTISEDEF